jgi:dihydroorotate dehydrogenase electron transfer subunit
MFEFNTIVACGPKQMLNALKKQVQNKRYLAVCEEIMACGVGLCNGCVVKYDDNTFRRVCTDGPVLDGNRIVYE